nr:MGC82122 protein [Xenopus laevis]
MIGSSVPTLKVWSYVFSGVGILTMLLGFLGCLGSLKEIKCLLGFYFAFLLLLFSAQITIGVLVYTQRNNLSTRLGTIVESVIKNYGLYANQTDLEEGWDFAQEKMQCCGWYVPEDWLKNHKMQNISINLYPCSCRNVSAFHTNSSVNSSMEFPEAKAGFCISGAKDKWPVYQTGCMNTLQAFLLNNSITIVGVCIGIAMLELFVMTLSMCLCRNLDQNYNKLARYS